VTAAAGDVDGVVVDLRHDGRRTLLGRGDAAHVRTIVAAVADGPVDWMTLPRVGAGPAGVDGEPVHDGPRLDADDDLPAALRAALGVRPATAWDWMAALAPPPVPSSADRTVVRLDPVTDLDAIRACLTRANPGTRADPSHPDEAGWWGVRDGARLLGVIGAAARLGDPDGADESWHLHGLGTLPQARGQGIGGLLTAAAARAGFAAGVDWVSLGMYASNETARRVYLRLGFAVEGRFTSYRRVTSGSAEAPGH
jgi:ribosomal protein S18 acetylase RimI-like enzyme